MALELKKLELLRREAVTGDKWSDKKRGIHGLGKIVPQGKSG